MILFIEFNPMNGMLWTRHKVLPIRGGQGVEFNHYHLQGSSKKGLFSYGRGDFRMQSTINYKLATITITEFFAIWVLDTSLATHLETMSKDSWHTPMDAWWLWTTRWIHAHDIHEECDWMDIIITWQTAM